jgi:hypothetical protein
MRLALALGKDLALALSVVIIPDNPVESVELYRL